MGSSSESLEISGAILDPPGDESAEDSLWNPWVVVPRLFGFKLDMRQHPPESRDGRPENPFQGHSHHPGLGRSRTQ